MSAKAGSPRALWALAAVILLIGRSAAAQFLDQTPEQKFQIDPAHLAKPYASDSVDNSPDIVARPDVPFFRLPPGFAVNELLRDADGDGRAELISTFAAGFKRPHGLAFHDGYLYVADVNRVWRLAWRAGETKAQGPAEPVTNAGVFGSAEGHWTRNIVFAPDGKRFFVTVGSASNLGEDPPPRASVQSFAADGSDQRTLATGLRNSVGIAYRPDTNDLYVVVNERDGLGDDLVPDYLTRVREGGFYGWPYAYIGANPQPDFPSRPNLAAKAIVPDLLFQAHSAPLGLAFYEGRMFPPDYRGDAFVALHGSWNSGQPTGYKIVRVPFKNGKPAGYYENFLTGFWISGRTPAKVWGRPVALAVAADGSLLVSDDASGSIWRISYKKP